MESFKLPDMTCGGCVRKVTQAVQKIDPAAEVQADLASHEVKVQSAQPRPALEAALKSAGFEPA